MSLSPTKLFRSFRHAFLGLAKAFVEEQNFKIEIIYSIIVITVALFYKISLNRLSILIISLTILLALELINSIIERFIDILKPRVHEYVAVIKDLMSAAVLIAGISTLIITFLIFWSHLF